MKKIYFLLCLLFAVRAAAQTPYFPPLSGTAAWDTLSPVSLGWCPDKIDSLYQFLAAENSKAFIVLKDGKIVLEKYFGTFTQDSAWYWASAGKTITSFLMGKAQEEGFLHISDTSSQYLGKGWTVCTPAQEGLIHIRHQLTMTTGLNDTVPDNHCTIDTCLQYLANAGTRWAYHNAPYTLLENVLENATGVSANVYTQNKLKTQTGMTGIWYYSDFDNVFYSQARSMARFGLLMQHRCVWGTDTLLHDTAYINQMFNTSQTYNPSYGYLWWLNGKSAYMLPTTQFVFPGPLAPAAPADMYAGLGKNGQIVSISPSLGLVVVRMGESTSTAEVSNVLCNNIWVQLNKVMACATTAVADPVINENAIYVYPNPVTEQVHIAVPEGVYHCSIGDITGRVLYEFSGNTTLDMRSLANGIYWLRVAGAHTAAVQKIVVAH